jgi:glycine/D-amino acid oxidase-like deaminating enzyme
MSADGFPIYEASSACPGAVVVSCHSGVTLAAIHALRLAPWIAGECEDAALAAFSLQRFHPTPEVQHAN